MRTKLSVSVLAAALALSGCAGMSDGQKTATGAGVGAATGAAIGALTAGGWGGALGGAAIGGLIGGGGTYLWTKSQDKQITEISDSTQGSGVTVTQTEDNFIQLSMPSDISFATGKSELNPEFRQVLDRVASNLKNYPNSEIVVAGHTDNTGTDAINNPLSLNRAQTVRNYLISQGVSSSRIRAEGFGSKYPVASNSTAAGRADNRRVEIYIGQKA